MAHTLNKSDLFDVVGDNAVEKIDERCALYLMKHEDHVQWLILSRNHFTVKKLKDDRKNNDGTEELPIKTSEILKEWIKNKPDFVNMFMLTFKNMFR